MTEHRPAWRYGAAALLCVSLLGGAWLRLSGLTAKSISHPEMYVPGIPLPEGISEPAERTTVSRILTGTFSSDTHPPGYYLFMLPWTRVMGTSLRAIRLPSAILGIACIPLLFWVGSLAGRRLAGSLAAALLAFSGYHVFWSKVGRMFALNCFLGLAATVLLLLIARSPKRQPALIAAYTALILMGVASHVFFWSLFAAHMIWAFGNALGGRDLPDICRAQLLGLVLGSPLIAFAMYQSGNTVAELSDNIPLYAAQFVSFAFALPTGTSGFFPAAVPFTGTALSWAVRGALALIGAILSINGLRQLWRSPSKPALLSKDSTKPVFWTLSWIAAGVAGTLAIAGFVYVTRQLPPEFVNGTIRITKVLSVLPFVFTAVALLLDGKWGSFSALGRWTRWLAGERGLLALLALTPLVALSALSQIRPVLNQRGFLFAAPYLLLLLAIGFVALPRRTWIAGLAPILVAACAASLNSYRSMIVDPVDYTRFASSITPEIAPGDLVFVRKAWYETPILYYLQKDRYHLVGRDFGVECARNPAARVWVVLLYDSDPSQEMQRALTGYRPAKSITAPSAKAILYEPRAS